MFISDMPNVPPQEIPVLIAQANESQQNVTVRKIKLGNCMPIGNMPNVAPNLTNTFSPKIRAQIYFDSFENQKIDGPATISVLQNPKYGVLRLVTDEDHFGAGVFDPSSKRYVYIPKKGYLGNDNATIQVSIGSKIVEENYYFKVVNHPVGNDSDQKICENGPFWGGVLNFV